MISPWETDGGKIIAGRQQDKCRRNMSSNFRAQCMTKNVACTACGRLDDRSNGIFSQRLFCYKRIMTEHRAS